MSQSMETSVGTPSQYTFSNLTANQTISAQFAQIQNYTISASVSGTGGTITPNGTFLYKAAIVRHSL
jgi:hypothetical protein